MSDGFLKKMKDMMGIELKDDDYEPEGITDSSRKTYEKKVESHSLTKEEDKVIAMEKPMVKAITTRFKIVVIEPKSFEECPKLVDNLKTRKPVIINLEKIEVDTARKIFDFLSGATYALNGNVQKIANNIFVFLPENVDVSASSSEKAGDKNSWR